MHIKIEEIDTEDNSEKDNNDENTMTRMFKKVGEVEHLQFLFSCMFLCFRAKNL